MRIDHAEPVELSPFILVINDSEVSPVHLESFSGTNLDADKCPGEFLLLTRSLEVITQDRFPTRVPLGLYSLLDDGAADEWILFEYLADLLLEGIEFARPLAPGDSRTCRRQVLPHGSPANTQLPGYFPDGPLLDQTKSQYLALQRGLYRQGPLLSRPLIHRLNPDSYMVVLYKIGDFEPKPINCQYLQANHVVPYKMQPWRRYKVNVHVYRQNLLD